VAVDRNAHKLTIARGFGATDIVNPDDHPDYVEVVRSQIRGGGVDHAFEAIGNPRCCAEAVRMLAPHGTATIVGIFADGVDIALPARLMLTQELRIQGSYMGSTSFRRDIPMLVELYLSGRLLLDELVDPRLTLDEVRDGFDRMTKGTAVRPVIDFANGNG
jgi:Zn-dependent alcohol dehydrogenase